MLCLDVDINAVLLWRYERVVAMRKISSFCGWMQTAEHGFFSGAFKVATMIAFVLSDGVILVANRGVRDNNNTGANAPTSVVVVVVKQPMNTAPARRNEVRMLETFLLVPVQCSCCCWLGSIPLNSITLPADCVSSVFLGSFDQKIAWIFFFQQHSPTFVIA